ncbi:MAG TPA: ATP-binding protein, partial [Ramlibacter sp.]|nr:ATP-binding protein [Ramlibacter sp.]
ELQTSRARLARALEASGLGLWEYDLRSDAVHLSQGWARLLGFPMQDRQVRAQDMLPLFPPHELRRLQAMHYRLLKGEIPQFSAEHEMTSASGQAIWVQTEAQVIERDADGRARKVVGTCRDISARHQAEQRMQEALRAADQASHAKSEFLATMSHEIRTPLNGVIGLTQLLAASDLPAREAESVAMIDSCAKSLLSVVDNILDFSKIEAGRLTLEQVPTDLAQLVRELSDVFRLRAAEKGLRFDLRQDAQVPRWIAADPGRLRQILLNLLGNALKFTAQGGFSLDVSLQQGSDGQELCFAVFDTGIGISEVDQARLFTRFTQADASPSRAHSGTGLGLAISRQLAQMMGGDVTLASRKEHGSTFTLRVPLHLAPAPVAAKALAAGPVRRDARILLAEDNEVNQLVAQRLLASLGYERVTAVFTGREAVHACSAQDFDLVLMDCQMPVMDGWEATRELRRLGVRAPVLAFTASATSADRERCLAAGMNDYLAKPVELAVLAGKVQRWLAQEPATDGSLAGAVDAAPAPTLQVFNPTVLSKLFLGDMNLFAETRELFMAQTRPSLARLCANPQSEVAEVRKAMHSIRGAASMLGAERLAEACRRTEADEQPTPEWIASRCQEVQAAFEAFVTASQPAGSDPPAAVRRS